MHKNQVEKGSKKQECRWGEMNLKGDIFKDYPSFQFKDYLEFVDKMKKVT